MAPVVLTKPTTQVKPGAPAAAPKVYDGPISARGIATGIITRTPAPADEVRLVVLNSLGEVASETSRPAHEVGAIALSFSEELLRKAGKEVYFLMVKGYVKGLPVWETRLGRYSFHS